MPDYDAIVIGAGHNGLTAAAVMARGGLRVLCLEKNHFIGGMASTTELIRGYRFELAGSIQFPVPNEIFEDLELGSCPIYEPEVQSASIGDGEPAADPALLGSGAPARASGRDARRSRRCSGWPRWPAWAEAPARAIGRFDVRRPPRSLDEMWDCATNEAEREAIRTAHVRECDGRRRPLPPGPVEARAGPQHAELSRRQLHLPRPVLAGQRAVPRLRPGVAGYGDDVKGPRRPGHHRRSPVRAVRARTGASCGGTPRSLGIVVDGGRRPRRRAR